MWRPANFQVLSLLLLLLLQVDSGQESCEIANCVVHRVLRERESAAAAAIDGHWNSKKKLFPLRIW